VCSFLFLRTYRGVLSISLQKFEFTFHIVQMSIYGTQLHEVQAYAVRKCLFYLGEKITKLKE